MEPQLAFHSVIDFGTTRIKSAIITPDGYIDRIRTIDAPNVHRDGLFAESDPIAYLDAATGLLEETIHPCVPDVRIGLATQRSSFLFWEKKSGNAVTPLISWQDRRANSWCMTHKDQFNNLDVSTGLFLSPHYAGPKLAYLFATDKQLARRAAAGELLFGTLETFLIWKWTNGEFHVTDISMAARTLLVNIKTGMWSGKLRKLMNVPSAILPEITNSYGQNIPLTIGGRITALIADQAASTFAFDHEKRDKILINLGTGGFIVFPYSGEYQSKPGYLTSVIGKDQKNRYSYAFEGTINGIGNHCCSDAGKLPALDDRDPCPNRYCLPDTTGIGAPFWRADIPCTFSVEPDLISPNDRMMIIKEGLIFRVCHIIFNICDSWQLSDIYIAGGLAEDTFVCRGIAACLRHSIYKIKDKELTLLGLAQLTTEFEFSNKLETQEITTLGNCYLTKKYCKWEKWVYRFLNNH